MKSIVKELLLEIIQLTERKKTNTNHFKNAIEKMGGLSEIISQISLIKNWMHPLWVKVNNHDLHKLHIYTKDIDNDYYIGKVKDLFQFCPELNEVFFLEDRYISFNKNLSIQNIEELRTFVENNTEKKLGSIYKPIKKYHN